MNVGVPRESIEGEHRVALVPELVHKLTAAGLCVCVEKGAGLEAGFSDSDYENNGAAVVQDAWTGADIILKVRAPSLSEAARIRRGATVIGLLEPLAQDGYLQALASRDVTAFAMEQMPRISRAQSMDALSAMSTIAGYKAVLLAANRLPRFFPLLMTAAGTIAPARVLVIGAGVAGLQAIGTAKRLGAVVEAYDTRAAVKEEVESVGGRFIHLNLDAAGTGKAGEYGSAQTEDFYRRQQQLMAEHVASADVVIAAALVRGKRAPILISEEMVRSMRSGSVIVDLASDQGGNCSLTRPGVEVVKHGVTIMGPLNLPGSLPFHASAMYARTVANFLLHIVRDGKLHIDPEDPITRDTLLKWRGEVITDSEPAEMRLAP
jgi:NAD(P) transhydrogenase subunit alpha